PPRRCGPAVFPLGGELHVVLRTRWRPDPDLGRGELEAHDPVIEGAGDGGLLLDADDRQPKVRADELPVLEGAVDGNLAARATGDGPAPAAILPPLDVDLRAGDLGGVEHRAVAGGEGDPPGR